MLLLLVYTFILNIVLTVCDNGQILLHSFARDDKNKGISSFSNNKPTITSNVTYIDKEENMLRVPNMKKNYEEHKSKRKTIKKSPKRTIQKIIKKNRSRRKLYLNPTSVPTKAPIMGEELDNFYAQEEMMQKNENLTANNQVNQKKKRKWNSRVVRYPMPFKQLQTRKDYRRHKRSDNRQDLFILTDLDEIEFLHNDSDNTVVNAHVNNYW